MANPKKEFPSYVVGLLKTADGFSVCEFAVNDERRIRYIDKRPADLLYISLEQARQILVKHAWSENNDQEQQ